jgi:hypothetical protein
MRIKVSAVCAVVVAILLASLFIGAQTPNTANLGLVGDRFKPLTWDE